MGIPGVKSGWNNIRAGVPQGSILGHLLVLIYINDTGADTNANMRHFVDDTSLYAIVESPTTAAEIRNSDLQEISRWASQWLVNVNPEKTEFLIHSRRLHTQLCS